MRNAVRARHGEKNHVALTRRTPPARMTCASKAVINTADVDRSLQNHTPSIQNPVSLREIALQAFILFIPLILLFPSTFLEGEMAMPGTLLFQRFPWKCYAPDNVEIAKNWPTQETLVYFNKCYVLTRQAIANGEWPLWNHLEMTGLPMLANFQSTVLYPPRLVHLLFDIYTGTTLFVLLKLWFAGITAYCCARIFRMNRYIACFVSLAWMLSGYNLTWLYWSPPDVSAWAPLVLMGPELILQRFNRAGFFSLALGGTLLILAGHPETALAFGLGVGAYFVLRCAFEKRWGRDLYRPLLLAGGAWALVLLVCAAQIAPFLEYLPVSDTFVSRPELEHQQKFLPPSVAAALWIPRFYGHMADGNYWGNASVNTNFVCFLYPGIAVWLGIALLLGRRSYTVEERQRILALAVPALFLFFMAFPIPLLKPIQRLPLLDSMWRCYYVAFPMLAMPFLAGIGYEKWFSKRRTLRDLFLPLAVVTIIAGTLLVLYGFHRPVLAKQPELHRYVAFQLWLAGGFALASIAIAGLHILRHRPKALSAGITLCLVVDLVFFSRDLLPTSPREYLYFDTALSDKMQELNHNTRFSVWSAGIEAGHMQVYGLESLYGYDGITPHRMGFFMFGSDRWCPWERKEPLCGIDYYLFQEDDYDPSRPQPDMEYIGTYDRIHVVRSRRAFSRAFLVGQAEVITEPEALIKRMAEPSFDPARMVLTEAPPQATLPHTKSADLGTAQIITRTFNRVELEVQAKEDAILILSDAYYPGWTATIDDIPAEIFPAYYQFRGVIVPEGIHRVTFNYFPGSFQIGLLLSVTACIGSSAAAAYLLLRRRKSRRRKSA